MNFLARALLYGIVSGGGLTATADTFKCFKGGQTVYSDLPCAAGASRIDAQRDKVSHDQKLQAEIVRSENRRQLSELEYQAARDRYTPRQAISIPAR